MAAQNSLYKDDRQYCLQVGCRKDGDTAVAIIYVNKDTKLECKKGEETKKMELKGMKMNDGGATFQDGYIYCPEDIDRFCIA